MFIVHCSNVQLSSGCCALSQRKRGYPPINFSTYRQIQNTGTKRFQKRQIISTAALTCRDHKFSQKTDRVPFVRIRSKYSNQFLRHLLRWSRAVGDALSASRDNVGGTLGRA